MLLSSLEAILEVSYLRKKAKNSSQTTSFLWHLSHSPFHAIKLDATSGAPKHLLSIQFLVWDQLSNLLVFLVIHPLSLHREKYVAILQHMLS